MPARISLILLPLLLLVGCANRPPEPSGPMSVVIRNPFNTLTGGRFEAPVEPDGSFANGTREGNSSVMLYGQVAPAGRGSYEVTFGYDCTVARGPSVVDSKSLQATVITRPNDPQPVGSILIKDGTRHPYAADDMVLELRVGE